MKHIVRKTHKYLSFLISLQLLLWTVSGIYFAFNRIELVRGEQYLRSRAYPVNLGNINLQVPAAKNLRIANRLDEVILIIINDDDTQYLDVNGKEIERLSVDAAMRIVRDATILDPRQVELVSVETAGAEYRGRALPLYRVVSANKQNEEINVYVNAYSGEIAAIRSRQWRYWDILWGLHIMDWQERDNIDNLLLKIFSVLSLVSSVTGLMLFFRLDIRNTRGG